VSGQVIRSVAARRWTARHARVQVAYEWQPRPTLLGRGRWLGLDSSNVFCRETGDGSDGGVSGSISVQFAIHRRWTFIAK